MCIFLFAGFTEGTWFQLPVIPVGFAILSLAILGFETNPSACHLFQAPADIASYLLIAMVFRHLETFLPLFQTCLYIILKIFFAYLYVSRA